MSKIQKVAKITFTDVIKQKKLEQEKLAKEKEAIVQAAKELQFDKFVRNTAKDMLKDIPKYQLKIFNADASSTISSLPSENSVWASWCSLCKKKSN